MLPKYSTGPLCMGSLFLMTFLELLPEMNWPLKHWHLTWPNMTLFTLSSQEWTNKEWQQMHLSVHRYVAVDNPHFIYKKKQKKNVFLGHQNTYTTESPRFSFFYSNVTGNQPPYTENLPGASLMVLCCGWSYRNSKTGTMRQYTYQVFEQFACLIAAGEGGKKSNVTIWCHTRRRRKTF